MNQIDVKGLSKSNNDLLISHTLLGELPIVGSVTLVQSERSEYCALFDDIFTKYKEEKGQKL